MTRSPSRQRPGAPRSSRRLPAALLAPVIVVLAIVGLGVGLVPLPTTLPGGVTLGGMAAPAACATPAVDGTISVAVAVDPGGVPGMAGGLETMCVTVPAGATGADVLAARARALGRPLPRYASSGLLCAIDGQPATGCGERVDGAYRYWAYFLGSGSWTYAGTGPALRRASVGQLEGWRFVAGAGNATDPPPRTSASPASICVPPPAPPPATSPSPPTVPLPAPAPGGGPGSDAPGAEAPGVGAAGGGARVGYGGMGRVPSGGGIGGADGNPVTGDRGAEEAGSGTGEGDDAEADVAAGGGARDDGSGGGNRAVQGDEVAGELVADRSAPSTGPPLGVLAVVALVGALAAGAVLQVRRRGAA